MALEEKSRITLLFPAPESDTEFILLDEVITELVRFCGGATASLPPPNTVFNGWWISTDGRTHPDANILIVADAPRGINDPELITYLEALKVRCQRVLQEHIIWLTIEPITRVATADYVR